MPRRKKKNKKDVTTSTNASKHDTTDEGTNNQSNALDIEKIQENTLHDGQLKLTKEESINVLLKGLLFVQDMYKVNNIEYFSNKFPEKYDFLFKRGDDTDEVIFQGSTAENLAIYRIEEKGNPEVWIHQLRWSRGFDYDVMYVKKDEIIDECSEYIHIMCDIMNSKKIGLNEWKEAEFCKHEKEPLVMMRVPDKGDQCGILIEHVGIVQPACEKCVSLHKTNFGVRQKTTDYNGRIAVIKHPMDFFMEFSKKLSIQPAEKNGEGHSCDRYSETGQNFNKYGDLCYLCRELNSITIKHEDAETSIFLDQHRSSGPSVWLRYYMNHNGKPQQGLPLYNEPGVSTIDVDNIPAFRFPLLEWSQWSYLVQLCGIKDVPKKLHL